MAKLGEANIGGRLVPAWLVGLTAEELDGLKWHSNPNLLDNWYFRNPVDQRGGYVVPPGTTYYNLGNLAISIGKLPSYATVVRYATYDGVAYPVVKVDGTEYMTRNGTAVRGYTGVGYGIDRWYCESSNGGVTVNNGSVTFLPGTYFQKGEAIQYELLKGKTVTLSLLDAENHLYYGTGAYGSIANVPIGSSGWFMSMMYYSVQDNHIFRFTNGGSEESKNIVAAKLELGSQQTLAHQENGVWVLNEIPDYGEQLRRCMRYFQVITNGTLVGSLYNTTAGRVYYQFPVTMRDNPGIIMNPKGLPIWCHSPANGQQLVVFSSTPNVTADGFDVDFYVSGDGAFVSPGWGVVINAISINSNNNEPICWATSEL